MKKILKKTKKIQYKKKNHILWVGKMQHSVYLKKHLFYLFKLIKNFKIQFQTETTIHLFFV